MASPNTAILTNGNTLKLESGGFGTTRLVEVAPDGTIVFTGQDSPSDFQTKVDARLTALRITDPTISIVEINLETPPAPPPSTPQQIEQTRQEETAARQQAQENTKIQQVDPTIVEESVPESAKPKGKAKLGSRILKVVINSIKLILPKVLSLATKYGAEQFEKARQENPELIEDLKAQYCPTPDELQKLVDLRNNIVEQLNKLGDKLKPINISVSTSQDSVNLLTSTLQSIGIIKETANAAVAIAPVASALGPFQSTINILNTVDSKLIPLLEKNSFSLDATAIPRAILSDATNKILQALSPLDSLILACSPNTDLVSISEEIQNIAIREEQAQIDEGSYKGFIFQVEEVPYSPTVTRRKAIALNQSNIPLLETELSFTANGETLINELKFIIDRDNLKPY